MFSAPAMLWAGNDKEVEKSSGPFIPWKNRATMKAEDSTPFAFSFIKIILEEAGSSLCNFVKPTTFLTHLTLCGYIEGYRKVRGEFFQ
jgi:hypothetical protein